MDVLLTHGYFLAEDPHERAVMKPYPPLGILYISAYLKARGFDVAVFDTTFRRWEDFAAYVRQTRPPVVGIYCNLLTRPTVLRMIRLCKEAGLIVVLGGPEPANYAEAYLRRGADVVVVGEGEATMEELLPRLLRQGPTDLRSVRGIVYREDEGSVIRTEP